QSRVTRLTATPPSPQLKPGESVQFRVEATYTDGSTTDVTRLCRYESRDEETARVDGFGRLTGQKAGDTAVIIRYGAEPVVIGVMVAPATLPKPFPDIKPSNFIDEHILVKLRALGLEPAGLCDDATFLRRLYLDVTGYLPPPDEVREFLASQDPNK